jgi:hypothetical protein
MPPAYYTVKQITTDFGFAKEITLGWIHSNQLKAINFNADGDGKRPQWRIAADDWDAFVASRAKQPPQQKLTRGRRRKTEKIQEYVH